MSKGANCVIGCYGDWRLVEFAESLSQLGRLQRIVTAFSISRVPIELRSKTTVAQGLRVRRWVRQRLVGSEALFNSDFMFDEFHRFDAFLARRISSETRIAIAWAGMAARTLNVGQECGCATALHVGSAHVLEQQRIRREIGEAPIGAEWVERFLREYEQADRLIVESEFVKETLARHGIEEQRIAVIPPKIATVKRHEKSRGRNCVFATIQLGRQKGTDVLLRAWESSGVGVAGRAKLLLIGQWPSELGPVHCLPKSVKWLGFLEKAEIERIRARVDFAIFPTHHDGGPRSLFELVAAGATAVTSKSCAGKDIVAALNTGVVIDTLEVDAWAQQIVKCVDQLEDYRERARSALTAAIGHFGSAAHEERTGAMLAELESSRRNH